MCRLMKNICLNFMIDHCIATPRSLMSPRRGSIEWFISFLYFFYINSIPSGFVLFYTV